MAIVSSRAPRTRSGDRVCVDGAAGADRTRLAAVLEVARAVSAEEGRVRLLVGPTLVLAPRICDRVEVGRLEA
jgi:hypothetical protein